MMATIRESELHVFGKTVFEDAVGRNIRLPVPVSPRFNPPLEHRVKRVEFEKELPFVGHKGRRVDVLLTSSQGVKIVVEVKHFNGKSIDYGFDLARAGNYLAVELVVSRWKDDKTLLPDFSSPAMLQGVLNQVAWLNSGKPCTMEWMPYTEVWHKYEHDVPGDRDEASRAVCAQYGINLRTVTVHQGSHKEHGWELHRDGKGLGEYRIRQPNDCTRTRHRCDGPHPDGGGFQAFDADHVPRSVFRIGQTFSKHVPGRILEPREQEDAWAAPVRTLWKDAVKDLFSYRAPGCEPIF